MDILSYLMGAASGGGGGGGGGAAVGRKDVNFLDYDGTVVDAYSASDFAALTAMPKNPSHDGLTAQGWNWTLADAQAYVAGNGYLDIGQMYITDDGKTRLYIEVDQLLRTDVQIRFSQTVANGVTVDWGDGSAAETFAGTGVVTTAHHLYTKIGNYCITLDPADDCTLGIGANSTTYSGSVMGNGSGSSFVYYAMLQSAEIGKNVVSLGRSAFYCCLALSSVSVPKGLTTVDRDAFAYCHALKSITIPSSVTFVDASFAQCYSLSSISFANEITHIQASAFQYNYSIIGISLPEGTDSLMAATFSYCYGLTYVVFPNGLTGIAANAFNGCGSLAALVFKRSQPPSVLASSAFFYLPTDCKIYVPAGSLAAYTSATNYPDPNTYTYIEY